MSRRIIGIILLSLCFLGLGGALVFGFPMAAFNPIGLLFAIQAVVFGLLAIIALRR